MRVVSGMVLLALVAPASVCAQDDAKKADGKVVESGHYAYLQDGKAFGSERYAVYEGADGKRVMQLAMAFNNVDVRGAGRLALTKDGDPIAFSFVVEQGKDAKASITATIDKGQVKCEVKKDEGKGKGQQAQAKSFKVDGPVALIEEGLIALDGLALRRYDREQGGLQKISVLVPQYMAVHTLEVEGKGTEEVAWGTKGEQKSQGLKLHVKYRGGEQEYWLDDAGRLLKCVAKAARGEVEIVRMSDAADPVKKPETGEKKDDGGGK